MIGGGMMNTEKFIKKWGKERQKGKTKYILVLGLSLGLGMLTGSIILSLIIDKSNQLFKEYNNFTYLISLISGFLGGMVGAEVSWAKNEEKYNHFVNDK